MSDGSKNQSVPIDSMYNCLALQPKQTGLRPGTQTALFSIEVSHVTL